MAPAPTGALLVLRTGVLAWHGVRAPPDKVSAPFFPRGAEWINVATRRLDQQVGRPVLIEFWDFCRANSLRTLGYLQAWHARYADAGLRVISVHAGGYPPAQDPAQVRAPDEPVRERVVGRRHQHEAGRDEKEREQAAPMHWRPV